MKEAVSQPQPAEEREAAYLEAAKALCKARGAILLVLALASIASILLLSKRKSNPRPSKRRLTIAREVVAAIVFVFFVLVPIAVAGSICPCMIGALQEGILVLFKGATLSDILSNLYLQVFIVAVLVSIIVGRLWCGWLCPVGIVQDYLAKLYGKVKVPPKADLYLSGLKYLVLAVIVTLVVLSQTYWFCFNACFILPVTSAIRFLGTRVSPPLVVGVILLILSVLIPRFFCKYLCPLGALLELMSMARLRLFKVAPTEKCRNCKVCVAVHRVCPMGLQRPGAPECISCGKCIDSCPFGAVGLKRK